MTDPLPTGLRLLNRAGRLATRMGLAPSLTPASLRRGAVRATGLTDWGHDTAVFDAGLEALCAAIDTPPALSSIGRLALHLHVHRALVNRLESVAAAPPTNTLLSPVLVVIGLPRSGTTFLHRLLALAPDARALALWEVQHPVPPRRGPDHRRRRADRQVQALSRIAPDLAQKHRTHADAPEECFFLLDDSLVSPSFPLLYPLEGYRQWRHKAPVTDAYARYRDHLRRLSATAPQQRLVLKAPGHTEHLHAIAEAVPEAIFVQTHRDPGRTVPSRASLVATLHERMVEPGTLHKPTLGAACLDDALHQLAGCARGRRGAARGRVIDVQHSDLVNDPLGELTRVHTALGLPLTDAHRAAAQAALEQQTLDVHGQHHYTATEYGLDADRVRALCTEASRHGRVPAHAGAR